MLMPTQRPEQNETSLAIVPRNHALLTIPNLEAEASGLLDRLLDVFHEEARYARDFILTQFSLTILATHFLSMRH